MKHELIKAETPLSNPQSLIQLAIESKLPIEHLERLMALKERYDAFDAKKEFLSAMSGFQSKCPPLEKIKVVDFISKNTGQRTHYKYASLGEITSTIKDSLKENELSYRWEMDDSTDKIICTCIVSHASGHSERSAMGALKDVSGGKNEIQSRGSTITYLQRYTLIAALGISTADEDTDAQATADKEQTAQQTAQPQQPKVKPVLQKMDGNKEFTNEWLNILQKMNDGLISLETVKEHYEVPFDLELQLSEIPSLNHTKQ